MNLEDPNAMIEMFEGLPQDRQDAVAGWFMVQRLITEHAGVERDEWFGMIQEALDHPLDFGFVELARAGNNEGVDLEQIEDLREKLGEKTAKKGLEGEGIVHAGRKGGLEQELLERFKAQRMSFESGRTAKKGRAPNGRNAR